MITYYVLHLPSSNDCNNLQKLKQKFTVLPFTGGNDEERLWTFLTCVGTSSGSQPACRISIVEHSGEWLLTSDSNNCPSVIVSCVV